MSISLSFTRNLPALNSSRNGHGTTSNPRSEREPHGGNGPRRTRFAQSLAFLHSSQSFLVLFNWIPNLLPLGHAQDGGHGQVNRRATRWVAGRSSHNLRNRWRLQAASVRGQGWNDLPRCELERRSSHQMGYFSRCPYISKINKWPLISAFSAFFATQPIHLRRRREWMRRDLKHAVIWLLKF